MKDYRAIQSPRAFVLTIIHNLALERLRRASVVRIDLLASIHMLEIADTTPDASAVPVGRSELEQLARLMGDLPPQCARA